MAARARVRRENLIVFTIPFQRQAGFFPDNITIPTLRMPPFRQPLLAVFRDVAVRAPVVFMRLRVEDHGVSPFLTVRRQEPANHERRLAARASAENAEVMNVRIRASHYAGV